MINVPGKYFRKFTPKELFTNYIYELMKEGKTFMVFPDNNQILIEDEADEWNKEHGLMDETERLLYHQYENEGYIVHYSNSILDVLVPLGMLTMSYEEFIKQCEEDVQFRME